MTFLLEIIFIIWCIIGVLEYNKKIKEGEEDIFPFIYGPFALFWSVLLAMIETKDWKSPFNRKNKRRKN